MTNIEYYKDEFIYMLKKNKVMLCNCFEALNNHDDCDTCPYDVESCEKEGCCNYRKFIDWLLEEHFDNRPSKVGKWIPCSERLPEKVDSYLVTMKNVGEYRWIGISMYFGDGKWAYDDDEKEVIAWMPKPELWDGDLE